MKKIFMLLILVSQQMYIAAFGYKKIPLFLGIGVVVGSLYAANKIQKHNELVPAAIDQLSHLKTLSSQADCQEDHEEQKLILDNREKRRRIAGYNAWYYLNTRRLAGYNDNIWYSVFRGGETNIVACYCSVINLSDEELHVVFEDTLKEAQKAAQFYTYDPVILSSSLGLVFFGTYFYLKLMKSVK